MQALSYLFSPIPGSAFNYATVMYGYAIALIVIAVALKIFIIVKNEKKAFRRVYKRTPGHFIWIAVALIILTASRTTAVPYLSMRFLLYITLFVSLFLVGYNIYEFFTTYPEIKQLKKKTKKKKAKKKKYSTKKRKK